MLTLATAPTRAAAPIWRTSTVRTWTATPPDLVESLGDEVQVVREQARVTVEVHRPQAWPRIR